MEESLSLDETGTDSKEIRILQNGNLLEKEHQVSSNHIALQKKKYVS